MILIRVSATPVQSALVITSARSMGSNPWRIDADDLGARLPRRPRHLRGRTVPNKRALRGGSAPSARPLAAGLSRARHLALPPDAVGGHVMWNFICYLFTGRVTCVLCNKRLQTDGGFVCDVCRREDS